MEEQLTYKFYYREEGELKESVFNIGDIINDTYLTNLLKQIFIKEYDKFGVISLTGKKNHIDYLIIRQSKVPNIDTIVEMFKKSLYDNIVDIAEDLSFVDLFISLEFPKKLSCICNSYFANIFIQDIRQMITVADKSNKDIELLLSSMTYYSYETNIKQKGEVQ